MDNKAILTGLIGILAFVGCSVKEDRMSCPLCLSIDMGAIYHHSTMAWAVIRHDDGFVREEVTMEKDSVVFEWAVAKGEIVASAYCGLDKAHLQEHRLIVPKGERVPLFFGSVHNKTCSDDTLDVVVADRRQSAKLNLHAVMPDGKPYPYALLLEGDICGTDLLTLSPVKGEFGHALELDGDNRASCQILRQDESGFLVLHVIDGAETIESIPLGELILKAGYDWGAEDLEDIDISLEQSRTECSVTLSDWVNGGLESRYEFTF